MITFGYADRLDAEWSTGSSVGASAYIPLLMYEGVHADPDGSVINISPGSTALTDSY